jgi:hypothetical protein
MRERGASKQNAIGVRNGLTERKAVLNGWCQIIYTIPNAIAFRHYG